MAQTQVVIVYSPNFGSVRTVIVPDDDSQIALHAANLVPGEAVMVGQLSDLRTLGADALLARFLGRPAINDRCAVVNAAGVVLSHVRADPAIDSHPRGVLHHDPHAKSVIGQIANIPSY